jgi:exosome complex component RRP45
MHTPVIDMRKEVLPNVQVDFLRKALAEGCRTDSRKIKEWRKIEILPNEEYGNVQVCLGDTRVHGIITAQILQPYADKQTEGRLVFNTEFSPMADPRMDPSKFVSAEV